MPTAPCNLGAVNDDSEELAGLMTGPPGASGQWYWPDSHSAVPEQAHRPPRVNIAEDHVRAWRDVLV